MESWPIASTATPSTPSGVTASAILKERWSLTSTCSTRAVVVGGVDAVTAGWGSKIAAAPGMGTLKKELLGTGLQMAGGATGEAAAQIATEGEISQPAAVLGEGLGELATGAAEQGGQIAVEVVVQLAKQRPAACQVGVLMLVCHGSAPSPAR